MRIVVVAHGLRTGGGISVGRNIIAALGRLAPEHQFLVTIPPKLGYEEVCAEIPQYETSVFGGGANLAQRWYYDIVELPRLVRRFGADVALGLGNVAVQGVDMPQALLLHNPYYVYSRRHYGCSISRRMLLQIAVQRWQFARDLRGIRLLLCQTKAMEERVRGVYGYRSPVQICPNAVSQFALAEASKGSAFPASLARAAGKRRLLYLTAYYSHKNLEVLVDLFRDRASELRDYAAVITVSPDQGAGATKLLKAIREHGLDDSIVNVGPLPQTEIASYFANCHALLMPTLLESFSGAYLEAMHFGLPILTSGLDFAREVCGDAASYFDPWDLNSIVGAIRGLEQRSVLVAKGKARLKEMFCSWDDVGQDVLRALEEMQK